MGDKAVKRISVGVAAFAVSLWAGWHVSAGQTASAEMASVEIAPQAGPDSSPPGLMLCSGGPQGPMGVEIEPLRTVAGAQGDTLRYAVRLDNRTDAALSARYAVELVTDVGAPVMSPATSAALGLGVAASRSDERATPAGLADGFYILRLTAVATGAEGDTSKIVSMYLEVADGHIYQLDADQFYGRSNANHGVQQ